MRLAVSREVRDALDARRPVVALESTVIAHGLPRPDNLKVARELEQVVRDGGATPATIALAGGQAVVGVDAALLERLAAEDGIAKVSLRDIAPVLADPARIGATTVAATVEVASRAGIAVFATGGIGGVHRDVERTLDVSADLGAIARHPVCVVCAGAKMILDLPRTLEYLETLGVPVVGYETDDFPAFYVRSSGLRVAHRADDAGRAARIVRVQLDRGAGLVIAVPPPADAALASDEAEAALARAVDDAERQGVRGAAVTPHLLRALGELSEGRSVRANAALLRRNAEVGAAIARALAGL